mgnify:CR=1 FL=1
MGSRARQLKSHRARESNAAPFSTWHTRQAPRGEMPWTADASHRSTLLWCWCVTHWEAAGRSTSKNDTFWPFAVAAAPNLRQRPRKAHDTLQCYMECASGAATGQLHRAFTTHIHAHLCSGRVPIVWPYQRNPCLTHPLRHISRTCSCECRTPQPLPPPGRCQRARPPPRPGPATWCARLREGLKVSCACVTRRHQPIHQIERECMARQPGSPAISCSQGKWLEVLGMQRQSRGGGRSHIHPPTKLQTPGVPKRGCSRPRRNTARAPGALASQLQCGLIMQAVPFDGGCINIHSARTRAVSRSKIFCYARVCINVWAPHTDPSPAAEGHELVPKEGRQVVGVAVGQAHVPASIPKGGDAV